MPKISVIVPVYNVEAYLDRCIESILAQTFADLELILIDDGSPDRSGEICDKYAAQDSRVKVLHKENGGVSSARNRGMALACGEYIMFVDGDDYIDAHSLEILLAHLQGDTDLVLAAMCMLTKYGTYHYKAPFGAYSVDDFLREFFIHRFDIICFCGPWNKLYRRELIEKNAIRFREDLSVGEDTYFNLSYILFCQQLAVVEQELYFYDRQNESSLFSKVRMNHYHDAKEVYLYKQQIARQRALGEDIEQHLLLEYLQDLVATLYKAVCTNDRKFCLAFFKEVAGDEALFNHYRSLENSRSRFVAKLLLKRKYLLSYTMLYVKSRMSVKR